MKTRIVLFGALAVVLVLAFASQAFAATDNIVITATVNSKITVTTGADYNFGGSSGRCRSGPVCGPGQRPLERRVHDGSLGEQKHARHNMLSINTPAGMDGTTLNAKAPSAAGFNWAQTYTLDLTPAGDWMDPGLYTADVLYTALP